MLLLVFPFPFQTLNSISAEKNSTIIFPVPIDFISFAMSKSRDWTWRERGNQPELGEARIQIKELFLSWAHNHAWAVFISSCQQTNVLSLNGPHGQSQSSSIETIYCFFAWLFIFYWYIFIPDFLYYPISVHAFSKINKYRRRREWNSNIHQWHKIRSSYIYHDTCWVVRISGRRLFHFLIFLPCSLSFRLSTRSVRSAKK